MKTATCKRCNGKGHGTWVVAHMGVPGLCYACDGSGKVARYTMAERVDLFVRRCESHLAELEQRAADQKKAIERRAAARNARRARRGLEPVTADSSTDREILALRDTYRQVRRQLNEAKQAGKVTAKQQPATVPSRLAERELAG